MSIRMIMADDETMIIRGLQKLLDWEQMGIEITGEYHDGKHALEGIVKNDPDLALLDISMPGMTGIEILKEIKKMNLRTKVIFISGFQDFEYARAALEYGAVDYLLKPIVRADLIKAIEKCLPKSELLEKEEPQNPDYGKLVEIEDVTYTTVLAGLMWSGQEDALTKKLIAFSFMSFLEEYMETHHAGIVFQKNENVVMVLKGMERDDCILFLEELGKEIEAGIGRKASFLVGRQVNSMGEITEVYQACASDKPMLYFAGMKQPSIFFAGELPFPKLKETKRFEDAQKELKEAVISRNERLESCIEQYGKMVLRMSEGKKENACYYICSMILQLEDYYQGIGVSPNMDEAGDLLENARQCASYEALLDFFRKKLMTGMKAVEVSVSDSSQQAVGTAKKYIREHYQENLSLNILADIVHMNASYFSSYFKKNTGENFKDYVSKVRIEKAIQLLISTDKKTYEIAQEVGFTDARTFSEVFQKFHHETPNAYRRRVRKK